MNYLLWGLYIQHSATLGFFFTVVKRRKIVSSEGSLHKSCVPISVAVATVLGQNMTGAQSFC